MLDLKKLTKLEDLISVEFTAYPGAICHIDYGCARLEDLIELDSDEGKELLYFMLRNNTFDVGKEQVYLLDCNDMFDADGYTLVLGDYDDYYSMYCITYNCLYLEVYEAAGNVTEDDILKFGSDILSTGWVRYCSDDTIHAVEEPRFYADDNGNTVYLIKAPERKNARQAVCTPPDAR